VYPAVFKTRMTVVSLLVVLFAAIPAWAGPPPPWKWWQDEKFKAELRLTPEQTAKIDEVFNTTFPKLRASYEELNRREEQLSNLISAIDTTEADVLRQADQVEAVRSELSKNRTLMLFRMRRVLSPEQRLKLQQLQKDHERERDRQPPREPEHR
jgi:Spy/CpxP family protein refolding chaperone